MTTRQAVQAPADWLGSLPEFLVFEELLRRGLRPDVDFTFQANFFGGRLERGGLVIDFLFTDPPGLAIAVQGDYFHQQQGASVIARDRLARVQLAAEGITLIFIDESAILADVRDVVGDALRFIDRSFLATGNGVGF